jgi:hypothetical protein
MVNIMSWPEELWAWDCWVFFWEDIARRLQLMSLFTFMSSLKVSRKRL